KLQAQAEALVAKQSSGVMAKIRDIMEKHGLTTADIEAYVSGAKKRGPKPGAKAAANAASPVAKYRDPKTGAAWTGHGRAPGWIASAKDRSRFLVTGNIANPNVSASAEKRAGNYVRGPQAAKYRDPISGATWSGRGRAPAWLEGFKDRAAFLIDSSADAEKKPKAVTAKKAPTAKTVKSGSVSAKKAPAKQVTVKKTAAA